MRILCFAFTILAIMTAIWSCEKVNNLPAPSNIDLMNKPLPEVKAVLMGKWQLHYMRGGFCGVCEYRRENEYFEFGLHDHIRWTIDKEVMSDTTITWLKQEWLNREINVMEFYAKDTYMHQLSPDGIYKDTLRMYEPGPDGMTYYFTKVK